MQTAVTQCILMTVITGWEGMRRDGWRGAVRRRVRDDDRIKLRRIIPAWLLLNG